MQSYVYDSQGQGQTAGPDPFALKLLVALVGMGAILMTGELQTCSQYIFSD